MPSESYFAEAAIPMNNWLAPVAGEWVVLGVMSFRFESGLPHNGHLRFDDT